jgi:hypothetical protein
MGVYSMSTGVIIDTTGGQQCQHQTRIAAATITNGIAESKKIRNLPPDSKPRATMYEKSIVYDRLTRDYGMYLDGELVGFARNYHEAEVTLDQLVYELLSGQYFREAA